jgi:uncharacterized protein (DUF3084 family)
MAVEDLRLQARQELEGIGVSPESASFLVHDRPPGGWESLVTSDQLRAEIAGLRTELHDEVGGLRTELRDEIATLRTETREEFGKVRAEMANLAAELRKEMQSQTRWLTGVLLVGMSLVAGILRIG